MGGAEPTAWAVEAGGPKAVVMPAELSPNGLCYLRMSTWTCALVLIVGLTFCDE